MFNRRAALIITFAGLCLGTWYVSSGFGANEQEIHGAYGALRFRETTGRTARENGATPGAASSPDNIRILNGHLVPVGKYPWILAMVDIRSDGPHLYCGASLVANHWAITAAHCGVRAGDTAIKDRTVLNGDGGRILHVTAVYSAPFNETTIDDDIALLWFSEPIEGPWLPLDRQPNNLTGDGSAIEIAGWGRTSSTAKEDSNVLLEAEVQTVSMKGCRDDYSVAGLALTENMFCAAAEATDACVGDSGGPALSLSLPAGVPHLVGLVSWGKDCGQRQYPGVYTNVSNYAQSIDCCLAREHKLCKLSRQTPTTCDKGARVRETLAMLK
jgi:secreted trypsin-like serine protease